MDMMAIRRGLMSMANDDCKLLSTIIPQTGQKICQIPLNDLWLNKYSCFAVVCDIKFTPSTDSEWVYFLCNSTAYLSGRYYSLLSDAKNTGMANGVLIATVKDGKMLLEKIYNVFAFDEVQLNSTGNYLCVSLYTYTYDAGTEFKLYGIK